MNIRTTSIMETDEFVSSLRRLGLKRASKHTAEALGISLRNLQRLVAGHVPVPNTLALLVIAYLNRAGVRLRCGSRADNSETETKQ
jgi:hypothetical protein